MKRILSLFLLFVSVLFFACETTMDWRLNVKDGGHISNDGGFGRFNEQGSPPLRGLDMPHSSPQIGVFILNYTNYGISMSGVNTPGFSSYGRQGHSEKQIKTWTVSQMKDAVKNNAVGAYYSYSNPRYFYIVRGTAGNTFRLEPSRQTRITGSASGNGNIDVKLFPDRVIHQATVILPNINN